MSSPGGSDPKIAVYLDNAATTWPKPEEVCVEVCRALAEAGNPGRSGHTLSLSAARLIYRVRQDLARLIGADDPSRLVFTMNATDSINMALKGFLKHGDRVLISGIEHNSVWRPVRVMADAGHISLEILPVDREGRLSGRVVEEALAHPAALVVVSHASNVAGTINPIEEIAGVCARAGACLLVDAAQSAGVLEVDVGRTGIDMLAISGHKGLFGPQGIGALYIRPGLEIRPWREGGTGTESGKDTQPTSMPEALESGTPNTPGIAGLGGGVRFVSRVGLERVREHDLTLTAHLLEGLQKMKGVSIVGPNNVEGRLGVVSIVVEHHDYGDIAHRLDVEHGVMVRAGLHCSPLAHRSLGTYPSGAIRFSFSYFTQDEHIDQALKALAHTIRQS